MTDEQYNEAFKRWRGAKWSLRKAAKTVGIPEMTFKKEIIKRVGQEQFEFLQSENQKSRHYMGIYCGTGNDRQISHSFKGNNKSGG